MKALLTKTDLQLLPKMSEPSFCFLMCEVLLKNKIHICNSNLITADGEQLEGLLFLPYFIEKLIYESNKRFILNRNLEQLVKDYEYIFVMELGTNDALVAMLA